MKKAKRNFIIAGSVVGVLLLFAGLYPTIYAHTQDKSRFNLVTSGDWSDVKMQIQIRPRHDWQADTIEIVNDAKGNSDPELVNRIAEAFSSIKWERSEVFDVVHGSTEKGAYDVELNFMGEDYPDKVFMPDVLLTPDLCYYICDRRVTYFTDEDGKLFSFIDDLYKEYSAKVES